MPASRVSALHSIGDIVTGRFLRGRSMLLAVQPSAVYRSANQSIPAAAFTQVVWDTVADDALKAYNVGNSNWTFAVPGIYMFQGNIGINNIANSTVIVSLMCGGGANEVQRGPQTMTTTAGTWCIPFMFVTRLHGKALNVSGTGLPLVGKPFDIRVYQAGPGATNVLASNVANGPVTYCNVFFLGGA
jgi:hypothetical protein